MGVTSWAQGPPRWYRTSVACSSEPIAGDQRSVQGWRFTRISAPDAALPHTATAPQASDTKQGRVCKTPTWSTRDAGAVPATWPHRTDPPAWGANKGGGVLP